MARTTSFAATAGLVVSLGILCPESARADSAAPAPQIDGSDDKFWSHPECGTMKYFGEGMAAGMGELFGGIFRVTDILVPDLGVRFERRGDAAFALAWPLVLSFGRPTATHIHRYHCSDDVVRAMQPHRVAVEPSLALRDLTVAAARLSYGYVWHPEWSRWGVQVDAGPTVLWRASQAGAALGPQLSVRYGRCCGPMYLVLALRYDFSLSAQAPSATLLKLGLSYR